MLLSSCTRGRGEDEEEAVEEEREEEEERRGCKQLWESAPRGSMLPKLERGAERMTERGKWKEGGSRGVE